MSFKATPPVEIDQKTLISAYEKGLLYANRKLKRFEASGLAIKLEPLDLVNDAFEKTLSSTRAWDPEKNPDLFVHIAGCISSILSNIYTSADFRETQRNETSLNLLERASSETDIEKTHEFNSKIEFILDYIAEIRIDLIDVAKIILTSEVSEPAEIAEQLKIPIKEVNTKKLAIKRVMKRPSFLLHYISSNEWDLLETARAMYIDKINNKDDLAKYLRISVTEAKNKMHRLERVRSDIQLGNI